MAKGRDMVADSIDDVLALARSRRQSGLLSIEHLQGGRVEEGEIYFQSGQPIYARVGRIVGQDALSWLTRWHPISFAFLTDVPRPPSNIPALEATASRFALSAPKVTASPTGYPSLDSNEPRSIRTQRKPEGRTRALLPPARTLNQAPTTGIEQLTPRKNGNDQEVLAMPLTRPQRFIYFLVDGHRTLIDLARCTGKSIREVERILSELQAQGLITV